MFQIFIIHFNKTIRTIAHDSNAKMTTNVLPNQSRSIEKVIVIIIIQLGWNTEPRFHIFHFTSLITHVIST